MEDFRDDEITRDAWKSCEEVAKELLGDNFDDALGHAIEELKNTLEEGGRDLVSVVSSEVDDILKSYQLEVLMLKAAAYRLSDHDK